VERFTGPKLAADDPQAPKLTGFERVEEMSQLPQELSKLISVAQPIVYTELPEPGEASPLYQPLEFLKRTSTFLMFEDVKPSLAALRVHKDAGEISLLQKAVDTSAAAHTAAMKAVKPNLPEYQISALLQYEWEKRGCERAAYPSIVGSGHNSTVLHYSENTSTMKPGDVVVIDAAAECSMYAADITRTLPVSGHFTARQREIYDIVLGAQQVAIDAFQSGKSLLSGDSEASLTRIAKDYISAHGKDLHGQPLDQYFIHGIGHYIGLDVHDAGDYKLPLSPGMTFTIEPGIYIPEENLGIRIEDDFLVGEDGKLIKLSAALPSKADDVEKIMAGK
jgi:Xaa-Pro aminopeptidase